MHMRRHLPWMHAIAHDHVRCMFTGYFDAPGAYMYPLVEAPSIPPALLPEVTLVFCSIEGIEEMKVGRLMHLLIACQVCWQ